jgi:RHS repeat-associated protein
VLDHLPRREPATVGPPPEPTASFVPTLSLPKGGGALRDIGEKFSANPATGAGTLSVPLHTPPGRSGLQPQLSLSYDSGAGNGPFGMGWSLSIPSISRKTEKRLPRYRDDEESDTFILSGAEDLVPSLKRNGNAWTRDAFDDGNYRVERYRPRVEGLFARIERLRNQQTGEVHWRSIFRDNVTSVYGRSAGARIADPGEQSRVFRWLLEETRDDKGNVVVYEYKTEDGASVEAEVFERNRAGKGFANRYLKRCRYGNATPFQAGGELFTVVFDYGEHQKEPPTVVEDSLWPSRSDPFSSYRAGFEIRTYRLCRRVLVFHQFPELGADPILVRSAQLHYHEEPLSSLSFLDTIADYGHDGDKQKALPPLNLSYREPTLHDEILEIDPTNLPGGVDGTRYQWVDLDSEGIPGVLSEQAGAWFYKRNLGEGMLGAVEVVAPRAQIANIGGGVQQLMDVAGDGANYLVQLGTPPEGFHERTRDGGWGMFIPFSQTPRVSWRDLNLKLLDLDGDGLADLLISEDEVFRWHPSLGRDGYGGPGWSTKPHDEEEGPAVVFADGTQSIHLADMTGDGLTDIIRIRQGEVCYWPNLGYGRFGAKVTLDNSPTFDHEELFDQGRIRLADLDGSGTTDLIYLGRKGVTLWFNQAGNRLSAPHTIAAFPETDALSGVAVVDFLGTGTACLIWSTALPGEARVPLRYVDLMGGMKPHLLTAIDNSMGLATTVAYAPSTKFYLADRAAGITWVTKLPFPVQVAERVETRDLVGGTTLTKRSQYHHGHYDGAEREFAGFGLVESFDAEEFARRLGVGLFSDDESLTVPPVHTKTWFHTGAFLGKDRITTQYAHEYYSGDPDASHLPDSVLPTDLSARETREAVRALRGQILRQEVFADDNSLERLHPYTITEHNYEVRRVQPVDEGRYGVFFAHARETLGFHYERNPADPRLTHDAVLSVDEFGSVLETVKVAYPRRPPAKGQPSWEEEQTRTLASYSLNRVINRPDEASWYRAGVAYESRAFEVTGLPKPGIHPHPIAVLAAIPAAPEIAFEATPKPQALERRLTQASRTLYYNDALDPKPLPLGQIDSRALLFESYTMALTPGLVTQAFGNRVDDPLLDEGGYLVQDGARWLPSGRKVFAPKEFYQPTEFHDPFGNVTTVSYDHALLLAALTDPVGNVVTATHDFRVLQPALVVDANGNRSAARFDELGQVVATAVTDAGQTLGDTLDDPTTRFEYDLTNWSQNGRPNFVHLSARETHHDANTRWQQSFTYFDGFGRELMKKMPAPLGPVPTVDNGQVVFKNAATRWIGTGRTVFDNKGNAVKKYEPYFSTTSDVEDEELLVHWGVTPVLHYDPLSRLIRTDRPDGSYAKVEFTPWKQRSFDENDTLADSRWYAEAIKKGAADARAATLAFAHRDTPAVALLDPLGRTFLSIADNGAGNFFSTRFTLDIDGRQRAVTDARALSALEQTFDMAGRRLHTTSGDAGESWMLPDFAGKPIRTWDGRDVRTRRLYDVLRRPTDLFVKHGANGPELVAERTVHGEAAPDAAKHNLRGRVYQQLDGSGIVTNDDYDFKGNLAAANRQLVETYQSAIDWQKPPKPYGAPFLSSTTYDALNRPTLVALPNGNQLRPRYNETGLLVMVDVAPKFGQGFTPYVANIDYDAKGQRLSIDYGNQVRTDYVYDPLTFRLVELRSTRPQKPSPLQDLSYTYDPVGNIAAIADAAQLTVFFKNAVVEANAEYVYDAIYRLTEATGREHVGQNGVIVRPDASDAYLIPNLPDANDLQAMRRYTERYTYDEVGNILKLLHLAPDGQHASWTRRYRYDEPNNRLSATTDDNDQFTLAYPHDEAGNITAMPHLPAIEWNHANRMMHANRGGGGDVYFTYDAGGQRVRKLVVDQNGNLQSERIYLGAYETYREYAAGKRSLERESLHVLDGQRRIALVETKTFDLQAVNPPKPLPRYEIDNHLGSATVELDDQASVISYEEYHPFGTAAYRSTADAEVPARRYRYTGKERDEETGLYYHGARFYVAWLGRWLSPDPIGLRDGPNRFVYSRDNPVRFVDPLGTDSHDHPRHPKKAVPTKPAPINLSEVVKGWPSFRDRKPDPTNADYAARRAKASPEELRAAVRNLEEHHKDPHPLQRTVERTHTESSEMLVKSGYVHIGISAALAALIGATGLAFAIPAKATAITTAATAAADLETHPEHLEALKNAVNVIADDPGVTSQVEKVVQAAEPELRQLANQAAQQASDPTKASVLDKLLRYLLNPEHSVGGPKAKWFADALGFTRDNADELAKQIVFDEGSAVQTALTEHGTKFNQTIQIVGANGRIIDVTFAWIRDTEGVVRLVTGIPTKQ